MKFVAMLAGAALVGLASTPFTAAGELSPATATQGCDFFEAELIAYLCGHSAFVQPFGGGFNFKQTKTNPKAAPAGSLDTRVETRQSDEGLTLALTPWEGVRVALSGEALQYDNRATSQFFPAVGPAAAPAFAGPRGSKTGWLSVGVEYTLWDRRTDTGRYILNVIGNLESNPGGGPFAPRDLQQVGWQSGAKWTLGAGLSANYESSTLFRHIDNPGELQVSSLSRLLLANDDWGVGIGPRLQTTAELWHAPVAKTGWSEARLGGEALIAPFRRTGIATLRDLTLDLYATHSLGQASLSPRWNGPASAYEYGASARFNIQY